MNWLLQIHSTHPVAHAMYNSVLYANGNGAAQDYSKARERYQKAADAGSAEAKEALLRLPST